MISAHFLGFFFTPRIKELISVVADIVNICCLAAHSAEYSNETVMFYIVGSMVCN